MAGSEPNLVVVDAFKPVIDAALAFDSLWLSDYGAVPDRLTSQEAELLADYTAGLVDREAEDPEQMHSLAALAHLVAAVDHLNAVLVVLRNRAEEGGGR